MAPTLHLTSPLMHGKTVVHAQKALGGYNVFKTDFHPGPPDDRFGPENARAAIRAHYWSGFPQSRCTPTYGDTLDAILNGRRKLPPAYRIRRAARLRKSAKPPLRAAALAVMHRHLGEKERPPGSNRIAFASLWYGVIGPWCAMAVTNCYVAAGSKGFIKGKRYAYVPNIVSDARAGANGLALTRDPKPGDIACYDWNGDGIADHTGLFEAWIKVGETFHALEGNTAVGNDSNGGEVMRRERSCSQVQAFVHAGR